MKLLLYLSVVFSLLVWGANAQRPEKPNFVVLLADDLGWQDVKCYDNDAPYSVFETPYMDQLASEGVRFTQGYSPAPTCGPSRVGILSGKFPARAGKTHVQGGEAPKPYRQSFRMMDPYYSGRMELEDVSIAEALKPHGYFSGHMGKWHVAVNHNAFPQPLDQGFDWSRKNLGISRKMGDRLRDFATSAPGDEYQLDENGFASDQTTQDAIDFMGEAVERELPFFCYYAAWYVHTPIQTRTERLLEKYAKKMGYSYPLDGTEVSPEGQNNTFYGAMVEEFDYGIHRIVQYLKETDDPRWPGHKLIENTYLFLTSDNGGMERAASEYITDNYPLDRGKIRAEEGGVRVPFIVVGPDVSAGEVSDVMVNGLDFYPTMLSLAKVPVPDYLDGCDLSELLTVDVHDATAVIDSEGNVRDTLYWHFPHGSALHSTIRKDGWKLFRNYDHLDNDTLEPYRLYKLYDDNGERSDIEEAVDLVDEETEIGDALSEELDLWLDEVGARLPHYNPNTTVSLTNKELAPAVLEKGNKEGVAWVAFETDKAAVVHADLIYTLNGHTGGVNEEWFRMDATLDAEGGRAEAEIPEGTTHFLFNLIDENNFLISSEDVGELAEHVNDSSLVPAYVGNIAPDGEADFRDAGTRSPADTDIVATEVSESNGVPIRDTSSYTNGSGQTFTLTEATLLTKLTLQAGSNANFGSGMHRLNFWIGEYATGETELLQEVDLSETSLTSKNYYTIDFSDTLLPAGTYAFQLGWTSQSEKHDLRFHRANGGGTYVGGGRLYGGGSSPLSLPFTDGTPDDGNDLVFFLHGNLDTTGIESGEGEGVPPPLADNRRNYTYLYFENGFPTPLAHRRPQSEANTEARANPNLVIQTGYYSLVLDCDNMSLKGYDALAGTDYLTALHEDVSAFTPAALHLSMVKDGKSYTCRSADLNSGNENLVRLIQSTRFNKRFDHLGLVFESDDGSAADVTARLEVTAWSDRVVFKLDLSGVQGVSQTKIRVESPQGKVHEEAASGDVVHLALQPHLDTKLSEWAADAYVLDAYDKADSSELDIRFDENEYAFHVDIPAEKVSYPADKDRVDEYLLEVTNPGSEAENIPLVFDQPSPRAITGTVMTLCEEVDGRPIGIPVQIAKNWHGSSSNIVHRGSWLRGYTMLKLDPGESRKIRLRVVYGYWGGAAAVSHSQLSLIGWGKNWKWDESALGAWGESFTYDPTLHAGSAFMDDVRPTFTSPMNSATDHSWTENSGGGEFLVYRDRSGTFRWLKRLKTAYHWVGPNLTEVYYSGVTDDDKIRVTYTSRAGRTMDYHRRFHRYRYEFLENVDTPERLVYHQMAADFYDGPTFTNYYIGDANGLIVSKIADPGGNEYKGNPVRFDDRWLAIEDEMSYQNESRSNRGIISLSSTKNGEPFPLYLHAYGRRWSSNKMLFDLSAESVSQSYLAGDVIEGEVEFVMPPKSESVYWGEDAEFRGRLGSYGADAWKAVYDEYRYNVALEVEALRGQLLRGYPVEVESASSGRVLADLVIRRGGIGHVPIIVKGARPGLALRAERWTNGSWVELEGVDIGESNYYQGYQNANGEVDYVFNIARPVTDLEREWRVRIVAGSVVARFDDWLSAYGITGEDAGPTKNPDGDGLVNFLEFALGGDPSVGKEFSWMSGFAPGVDGILCSFRRRLDADLRGVNYTLEGE